MNLGIIKWQSVQTRPKIWQICGSWQGSIQGKSNY